MRYLAVNTYGWTEFELDEDAENLTVTTYGVDPYSEAEARDAANVLAEHVPAVVSQFTHGGRRRDGIDGADLVGPVRDRGRGLVAVDGGYLPVRHILFSAEIIRLFVRE